MKLYPTFQHFEGRDDFDYVSNEVDRDSKTDYARPIVQKVTIEF